MHPALLKILMREPVRAYMYSIIVPLVSILALTGVFSGSVAADITALVFAILGGGLTETIRSAVSPAPAPPQFPSE